jgi:hypothetical protein
MHEYVYRVDTQDGLRKIRDNHFRARRWLANNSRSFPHQLLKKLYSELSTTEGLYRICFYTSYTRAEQSLNDDFSYFGPSHILRCPKRYILSIGFSESWDDGFKEGDAYLFWIQEQLLVENVEFSFAGIPFNEFEIWNEGQWCALEDYYYKIALLANPVAFSLGNTCSSMSIPKKRQWWKIWCRSNS